MARTLYLITARAGSKGLLGKNTKVLKGKALIEYSIDFAVENITEHDTICVSTNDADVIEVVKRKDLDLPFVRPENLATDTASSYDVIIHAINFYLQKGESFDRLLLLQPTSPFRTKQDLDLLFNEFDLGCDMAVTVKVSKENPYFNLFEENEEGYLKKSKDGDFKIRQSAPPVYAYNGSMYLIAMASLLKYTSFNEFKKIRKVIMPAERSVDIDDEYDWHLAEYYSNFLDK